MEKLHIRLEQNQKVWFTSDLHLGHRNVIRFCDRPFKDEKEMGEKLIENWNNTVGENDIVFVLGDTFWFNWAWMTMNSTSTQSQKAMQSSLTS